MNVLTDAANHMETVGRDALKIMKSMQDSPIGTKLPSNKAVSSLVRRVSSLEPDLQAAFYDNLIQRVGPQRVLEVLGEN